jgi:hypothetical protein
MDLAEPAESSSCYLWFEEDGVEMDAFQPFRRLMTQTCDHVRSPVAALSDPSAVCIAQTLHQLCPYTSGATVVPSDLCRFSRECIPRQCWNNEVKGIVVRSAVRLGGNEFVDDVSELQD